MEIGIAQLERLAFDAWPAEVVETLSGWRLRFNHGVTHRASSVWPAEATGPLALGARIEAAEAFYRARDASALFQISGAAAPASLDAALEARGYERRLPTRMETADAAHVAGLPAPGREAGVQVEVSETLGAEWFELSGRRGRFTDPEVEIYRGLLGRARERPCFALARLHGEPAAVGLGVAQAGWLGLFAMRTQPHQRQRGLARAVLVALARHARARGEARLYLQVEEDNTPARALYTRAGFTLHHPYHYRRRELG